MLSWDSACLGHERLASEDNSSEAEPGGAGFAGVSEEIPTPKWKVGKPDWVKTSGEA